MHLTQKRFTAATGGERKELRDCIGFGSFRKYVELESKVSLWRTVYTASNKLILFRSEILQNSS